MTIVRSASTEDSRGIAAVHVSAWQDAYRGIVPQTHLDQLSAADREQKWIELLQRRGSETLVAEVEGSVVGFISFGDSRKEPRQQVGEVYAIYVASTHWSTGVGGLLWQAAVAQLRELGFTRVVVWVLAANAKAIRFYERIGFSLSANSETLVEIGGERLPELRFEIAIA